MADYWLGFLTPFLIAASLFAMFWTYVIALVVGKALGYKVEWKRQRGSARVTDFTLRHDIWTERQRGPIFYRHWYFERGARRQINRWVALGRPVGPCVMFFKLRTLPVLDETGADHG